MADFDVFVASVNEELPRRPNSDIPAGGNYAEGLPLKTTGVGMTVAPTGPRITVSATPPVSPDVNDLWVDIS